MATNKVSILIVVAHLLCSQVLGPGTHRAVALSLLKAADSTELDWKDPTDIARLAESVAANDGVYGVAAFVASGELLKSEIHE